MPLAASLVAVAAILVDPGPLSPERSLLFGLGSVTTSTVAVVGMVVSSGRWAHRLALVSLIGPIALALVRDVDGWWVATVVVAAVALAVLLSPSITGDIRKLPSASGPPPRAVLPPLILIGAPLAVGLAGIDSSAWALLSVGLTAPLAALLYSRVIPGGLWAVRVVWPALAIGLSPLLGWVGGLVSCAIAVAVAAASWGKDVKASYHPPREVGTTFPIPPELAPTEVLDAANVDEKGRPR